MLEHICTLCREIPIYTENVKGKYMTFVYLLIVLLIVLIANTLTNIYVILYLVLGIIWFIAARIIKEKLKDPDSTTYALIRIVISLAYLVGLVIVILTVNFTKAPIGFM